MKKIYYLILSAVLIYGCVGKDSPSESLIGDASFHYEEALKISPDITELSPDDAVKVATLAMLPEKVQSRTMSSDDVLTVNDSKGIPAMYVVQDNTGYTIVSATKRFYPIIAQVPVGSFDEGVKNSPLGILLDEYLQKIEYCNYRMSSDSLSAIRASWRNYEVYKGPNRLATRFNEVDSYVVASIAQWESEGYFVYSLNAGAPDGLPQDVYESYYNSAQTLAHPDYDYETYSFILVKRHTLTSTKGPLLTSNWRQGAPYNNSVPMQNGVRCAAGCVAIAMAQIMRYHHHTGLYDWTQMPDMLPWNLHTESELSKFISDIGQAVEMNYGVDGSGSNIYSARSAFINRYGYDCSKVKEHDAASVRTDIVAGRPVFMGGLKFDEKKDEYIGHAWVCDGFSSTNQYQTYTLMILAQSHELRYDIGGPVYQEPLAYYRNFHMNMGNGGAEDGWYVDDDISGVPYKYSRSEIRGIHHN